MDREDIIAMAREAEATPYTNRHFPDRPFHTFSPEQLERFFNLATAAEQDRILRIVYEESTAYGKPGECMWIGIKHKVRKALANQEKTSSSPCPTCESLARAVMMDQTGAA